jgi:hypothetical protein
LKRFVSNDSHFNIYLKSFTFEWYNLLETHHIIILLSHCHQ